MSDRDEHDEDGAPMELFWLGNFDEGNKVEADYLDEVSLNFGLINFIKNNLLGIVFLIPGYTFFMIAGCTAAPCGPDQD